MNPHPCPLPRLPHPQPLSRRAGRGESFRFDWCHQGISLDVSTPSPASGDSSPWQGEAREGVQGRGEG
jgi:hypothetical protein